MNRQQQGLLFGLGAYVLWGLFPLFWPLLEPTGAVEVLAHRVLWSLVAVGALLGLTRGWAAVRALSRPQVGRLAVAAALLSLNWGVYIYGVNSGHVVETSLGYFITPLFSVALGVFVLGERLRWLQKVAVAIATVAVLELTLAGGRVPVIALVLTFTFGTYGLIKKQVGLGSLPSLAVESAVVAPVALIYVLVLGVVGQGTFAAHGSDHAALLMATGVVSAVPLLLFGAAATRVPLSTLGVLQYVAPSLQLAVGLAVRHEPFGRDRQIGFGLVWIALALFTVDLLRARRQPVAVPAC